MMKPDMSLTRRLTTILCAAALCAAPLGLAACSSGGGTTQQAETAAETQAETTAETEEQAEPIYAVSKFTSVMDLDGSDQTIEYAYSLDDAGNILELAVNAVSSGENGNYNQDFTLNYDEQGLPISGVFGEGTSASLEAALDESGNLAKVVKTYDDNATIATWEFTYSEDGKISSLVTTSESTGTDDTEAYSYTNTFTFNEYGWATEVSTNTSTGESTEMVINYEGDDPAHPVSETADLSYSDGSSYSVTYDFTYDANGNLATASNDSFTLTYEYKLVENPGVVAKAFASVKEAGAVLDLTSF